MLISYLRTKLHIQGASLSRKQIHLEATIRLVTLVSRNDGFIVGQREMVLGVLNTELEEIQQQWIKLTKKDKLLKILRWVEIVVLTVVALVIAITTLKLIVS